MHTSRNNYRRPSANELAQLRRRLDSFRNAATFFDKHFVQKTVIYSTDSEDIFVQFSASNFMHLCGISYVQGAEKFFRDCLSHKLVLEDMQIKRDGTTFQKLQVLNSVSDLIGPHVRLTPGGHYLYLDFDYALRTKKQILAMTLKDLSGNVVPQSLLNLRQMKSFPVGEDIIGIYSMSFTGEKEVLFTVED